MDNPTDSSGEWFQVTIVFGNFKDRAEAERFRERMSHEYEYLHAEVKGSWH